jgi:pimeloyl-ACP methyl ester carboxylesterase
MGWLTFGSRSQRLHLAEHRGVGSPVVLLHGLASSSVTFQNVLPLIDTTHECFAIDLLGFGESPIPVHSDYTLSDHVKAIEHSIRALRIPKPFVIVGHSMGALIAARFAADNPRLVTKVVLVSPPIYVSPNELSRGIDRGVMDFYLRAYEYIRLNKEFTLRNAARVERLLPIPKAMDINERTWAPFVKSLENSIEHQTTISDLARIKVPVEVVYGNLDQFHSEAVLRIVSRLSGVSVHKVRGSDHLIGRRLSRVVAQAIG